MPGVESRLADLLATMTLEEKAAQLNCVVMLGACERGADGLSVAARWHGALSNPCVGLVYGVLRADPWSGVTLASGFGPGEGAAAVNTVQRFALDHSRLPTPILFAGECNHGHMAIGTTVFATPIGLASAFDRDLVRRVNGAAGAEARAQGEALSFSPVVDVARDPRWGRVEETFGEDPFLCSALTEAAVQGLQGAEREGLRGVAATAKHFAAYGFTEGGLNCTPAHVGPRELRDVFLPPFRAAVDAGARCLITSYNEIDGVPCTIHRELLTDVLRQEWGFDGVVISDLGAIDRLVTHDRVAADPVEAMALALEAGLDVDLTMQPSWPLIVEAVRRGRLAEAVVDRSVLRVLRLKEQLGLLDRPYVAHETMLSVVGTPAHRGLALEAARKSLVLLRNEGGLLPLRRDLRCIAVVGPSANSVYNLLGDYTAPQDRASAETVLDGVHRCVGPHTEVRYAPGCGIRGEIEGGLAEAVAAARAADVAVVVVGGSSARGFGPDAHDPMLAASGLSAMSTEMDCAEGVDKAELGLSGVQLELLQQVGATGTPMVAVLVTGRPVAEPWLAQHVPAVLQAWYPGQSGGQAVAEALFGLYCPSGRLPISVPRSAGQVPVFYSARHPRPAYVDCGTSPLFAFGDGESYTTFAYAGLHVEPATIGPEGAARVSVEVTNTGSAEADHVVLLFVKDCVASVTRPERELKGFARVHLAPGETTTALMPITASSLAFHGLDLRRILEPGEFEVMVGCPPGPVLTAGLTLH